jgi:hypothetical protein
MGSVTGDLISIRDLEGVISPHDAVVKRALAARLKSFEGFSDSHGLARHIGGKSEPVSPGGLWAICKEVFPGVEVHFFYDAADDEFPARLRTLYGGVNIRKMHGEDMADATVFIVNYMVDYVREAVKK